jgi:AraC-like DNA-binding protein
MDFVFHLDAHGAPAATLVGPMSTAQVIAPDPPARLFGIRFRPGIAALFADADASDLADRDATLEEVVGPRTSALIERVVLAESFEARVSVLKQFLVDTSNRRRAPHPRLLRAVYAIELHGGAMPIESIARDVGLTARQCERLFSEWVGVSPKKFSRVVRLKNAVARLQRRHPSLTASLLGYADQAHMIRDFQALAGTTPGKLLREMSDSFNPRP